MASEVNVHGFDIGKLYEALDLYRLSKGLSLTGAAGAMWRESERLNVSLADHLVSASTIANMSRRGDTTCQHTLVMLRRLRTPPENFIAQPVPGTTDHPLPIATSDYRLRWDLGELYLAINTAREKHGASWAVTANRLHFTPGQLTGLRTAKFATSMRLAMRICQSLQRPSADFIHPSRW